MVSNRAPGHDVGQALAGGIRTVRVVGIVDDEATAGSWLVDRSASCSSLAAAWRFVFPDDGAGPRGSGGRSHGVRRTGRDRGESRPWARGRPSAPRVRPAPPPTQSRSLRASELLPRRRARGSRSWPRSRLAHSMAVVRPGASAPGSDSLWLGKSNATTRYPASTSGLTNTARCGRCPPHPCTRYIGGPSPHSSPATRCPSQYASSGPSRGHTRRHAQTRLENGWGAPQLDCPPRSHERAPSRSSSQNSRRTRAATGGRTPEPATSSGGTSPACARADAGPVAPWVMNRDRSVGRQAGSTARHGALRGNADWHRKRPRPDCPVRASDLRSRESGWRDSNPRPLRPERSTLPSCATPRVKPRQRIAPRQVGSQTPNRRPGSARSGGERPRSSDAGHAAVAGWIWIVGGVMHNDGVRIGRSAEERRRDDRVGSRRSTSDSSPSPRCGCS